MAHLCNKIERVYRSVDWDEEKCEFDTFDFTKRCYTTTKVSVDLFDFMIRGGFVREIARLSWGQGNHDLFFATLLNSSKSLFYV